MSELDDKLQKILTETSVVLDEDGYYQVDLSCIPAIKQAFAEEGYIHVPQVEMIEHWERGKPTEYRVNGKIMMTGQEWYERFFENLYDLPTVDWGPATKESEKEYGHKNHADLYIPLRDADRAGKCAAGLEDKNEPL